MTELTLREIAGFCAGELVGCDGAQTVTEIVTDSRRASAGTLYLALRGERFDGHDFIPAAIRSGAAAAVSEKRIEGCPTVLVKDTLRAYQDIAAHYRQRFDIPVIGITGSVGKTSTKEMLAAVLGVRFRVLKTAGNQNNHIGVPATLLRLMPEDEVAIIEMGTNHFGEIDVLTRIARPTMCLITNIGTAHIGNFGSREGIFRGKTEIFNGLVPGGRVFVNGDDDYLSTLENAMFYGFGDNCAVRAEAVEADGLAGSDFTAVTPVGSIRVHVPAPGIHMVSNACAAIAVGLACGMTLEETARGAGHYEALRMQMKKGFVTLIDDSYNANPVSMKSSLDVLKLAQTRRVAILGDMRELGDDAEKLHAEVGVYAAQTGIERLICVGEVSRAMARAANAIRPGLAETFASADAVKGALGTILKKDDTVLVKASLLTGLGTVAGAIEQMKE